MEEMEKMLTAAELCKYLGITRQTLFKYRKSGLLPYYKISGNRVMFKVSDVQNFLEQGRISKM